MKQLCVFLSIEARKTPDIEYVSNVGMTKAAKWTLSMGQSTSVWINSSFATKSIRALSCIVLGALVGACSSSGPVPSKGSKGKFDPKYGVSASERVATSKGEFRKGGGHYKVGKPYRVAGKLYRPKHEPGYNKTGKASWYGDDFHGRLTANGEIFDMNTLTAAHPTLPLPSYARVTNLKNGRSVIVRINDRGPYAHNRIIDLSKRVAEVLAFKNDGITNVRVKYIGKARMDGQDERYLEASYRRRGQRIGDDFRAVPKEGQERRIATPVMVASNTQPSLRPNATRKTRSNYLLAHVPTLNASMIAPNPTPEQLSQPASAGWAPIDLVGDGYHPPKALRAKTATKPKPIYKLAQAYPVSLNYAPTYNQRRLSEGHEAIANLTSHGSVKGAQSLKAALGKKANELASIRKSNHEIGVFAPAYAMRLAREFAMLAAIKTTNRLDGKTQLSIVKLKAGVTWHDIETIRADMGLTR